MIPRRQALRLSLATLTVSALAVISGCGMMKPSSTSMSGANLVALSTQLRAANEVPPNASQGSGSVDAVLNKDTNLLRWKVSYTGLSGPATAAHFHGPAAAGANAGVVLPWPSPVASPMEGSATLTPAQAAELMAGRWYANIHTAANPGGEIRGQMMVRN
ncbi:CHRD domain-containing protein [Polaromonas sp.]|uniref:CHRD domain-containing protein n=1 Tax=Polaromonas sp. TaxID=1869339 RepID=UPI0013BBB087|nr:CHRD domain-containing protein [Polaromonas sp.]NDP62179.1 CHRD domain-containing protein [Polaromonas sp.]